MNDMVFYLRTKIYACRFANADEIYYLFLFVCGHVCVCVREGRRRRKQTQRMKATKKSVKQSAIAREK